MNYKINYRKYLTAATLDNAANKIMSSTFVVGYAMYLGLSDRAIGLYVASKSIMCLVQIFAASIFSKIGQSKKITLTIYSLYRFFGAFPIFIPLITQDTTIRTILFILSILFYEIFGQIGYTPLVNWRMSILKTEDRSRFYATKNLIQNTLVMGVTFGAGILLDQYTNAGNEFKGFAILFFIIVMINIIDIYLRASTYKPQIHEKNVDIRETIKEPIKDIKFRKILIFTALYTLSLNIGIQYLSLFELKYLGISYTFASILNVILSLVNAFFGLIWAKKYNTKGWKSIIMPMLISYIVMFVLLGNITVDSKFILPIVFILYGIGESAYGLFDHNVIYESAQDKYKTVYLSVNKTVCGVISILVPIITSFIMADENNTDNIKIIFMITIALFTTTMLYYKFNIAKENSRMNMGI